MAQTPMYAAMANSPGTELSADISASDATITVLDASKLPDAPNLLTVGSDETAETILYTGKSSNSLTGCTRGFNGTTAKGWSTGAKVARNFTGYDHDTFIANISDLDQRMSDAVTLDQVQEVADAAKQAANSYTDTRVEFLEAEIDQKLNGNMLGIEREVANLNLQLAASKRVQNGVTFGTEFRDGSTFNMNMDMTKTFSTTALAQGATSITVDEISGLSEGMEVTVYDDVNIERVVVQSISGNVLTVKALANAYKKKANVARTMAVIDSGNSALKFDGWEATTTQEIVDKNIVNFNFGETSYGGRKITRLSNGWIVTIGYNSADAIYYFYVSKDDGNTWQQLCFVNAGSPRNFGTLCSKGTFVYFIYSANNTTVRYCGVNALTVQNVAVPTTVFDTEINYASATCICIGDDGNSIHAAYDSRTSTLNNYINTRYCKGIINADGTVTWGTPENITKFQALNISATSPSITTVNGEAIVVARVNSTPTNSIMAIVYKKTGLPQPPDSDSNWSYKIVLSSMYNKAQMQLVYIPPSINGLTNGRLIFSYFAVDQDAPTYTNIWAAYSDNLGVDWHSRKITTNVLGGFSGPTITFDKDNNVYILFYGKLDTSSDPAYKILLVTNNNGGSSGGWGNIQEIDIPKTSENLTYPGTFVDLTLDMEIPPHVYNSTSYVGFSGKWEVGASVPLLENDVRFTLKDTDEVATWVKRDANLTLNAQFNGQDMDKTTVDNEDQFVRSITAAAPAEVRLRMTRPTVNDDLKITRILGGVN